MAGSPVGHSLVDCNFASGGSVWSGMEERKKYRMAAFVLLVRRHTSAVTGPSPGPSEIRFQKRKTLDFGPSH